MRRSSRPAIGVMMLAGAACYRGLDLDAFYADSGVGEAGSCGGPGCETDTDPGTGGGEGSSGEASTGGGEGNGDGDGDPMTSSGGTGDTGAEESSGGPAATTETSSTGAVECDPNDPQVEVPPAIGDQPGEACCTDLESCTGDDVMGQPAQQWHVGDVLVCQGGMWVVDNASCEESCGLEDKTALGCFWDSEYSEMFYLCGCQ